MKKNLFCMWLLLLATLFSVNTQAQMTVGGKKEPEPFSVLELLNKGGLRLPQMTTAERNAFAVQGKVQGEGLTIYNIDTKCVEYWNKVRWISLCEGTSQAKISPEPCINVAADGTGCNSTFSITDPDCPNGPFNIAIVAGGEYAVLDDLDNTNGSFKINFNSNESVNARTVLVRVTSTCTSLFKEFLFSQKGVDCSSMSYTVPSLTSSGTALCTGGAIYLSVPSNTANLDKLIWTRNGVEVARGVSYYVATQKGKYNISMGAVGCNTNTANEKNITESGTADQVNITALASNNGVLCGTNSVTLTASGTTSSIVWFHNGVEYNPGGKTITISGDSSIGEWFATTKNGTCYSKPSNSITVTKSEASGQISLPSADVLVNGVPLNSFTAFCSGGSLDLSIANKQSGVTYKWYNGNDEISSNPFIVPSSQTTMSLRVVATDNSGARCPAEASVIEKSITAGSTPVQPNITSPTNGTICDGSTTLTLVPSVSGTYTYTWYKDGVKMSETTQTITINTPGAVYTGSVTNATGCTSTLATKAIPADVSTLPVISWLSKPDSATFASTVTVQTKLDAGSATSYTWSVDKGTIIGSGASVSITLPAGTDSDNLNIKVTAQNSCGKSAELTGSITMNSACSAPIVNALSSQSQNVKQNSNVQVAVSVTNGVSPTYQWYSNTTASTSGGTLLNGATSSTYSFTASTVGTSYMYCIVTNNCTGNKTGTSPIFTIVTAQDPGTITKGSGSLSGRTCFDIAETEGGTACGSITSRTATKADFNSVNVYKQTYTFTPSPSGTVSNVRFDYVETVGSGLIVDKFYYSGNTATVEFKKTLSGPQGSAKGKDRQSALSLDIYAIFNDGTGDKQVKLTAKIQDCMCCGAMISATEWRSFMCHNLGADESLDPFTPQVAIVGNYYYWGANSTSGGYNSSPTAWASDGKKTANDPCPAGYRVPTDSEWRGVITYNTRTVLGTVDKKGLIGAKFGNSLMIPSAPMSPNGVISDSYSGYYYWSSYHNGSNPVVNWSTHGGDSFTVSTSTPANKGVIRCISEN